MSHEPSRQAKFEKGFRRGLDFVVVACMLAAMVALLHAPWRENNLLLLAPLAGIGLGFLYTFLTQ